MKLLKVGYIRKPHGVKGEIKVLPLTNVYGRYKRIKKLYIEDGINYKEYNVISVKVGVDEVILKLENINDRNEAELLRDRYLYIDRKDGEKLEEWEYYTQDLVGLFVYFEGKILGKVVNVINSGANDNLEIEFGNDTIFYPFLREFIDKVDLENNRIDINCYEGFFD